MQHLMRRCLAPMAAYRHARLLSPKDTALWTGIILALDAAQLLHLANETRDAFPWRVFLRLVTALRAANFPIGYVLGGLFADDTPPARAGSNEWVVAEIDERDGTIERFSPEITVAVNLDWDHPDFYRQAADLDS